MECAPTNLGILGVFKYYDFFIQSLMQVLGGLGLTADIRVLGIILPVGISFYTFQTLSYSIDLYRGKIKPTKDLVAFFAFVSFFPQLVAGPIERAKHLLPQFERARSFDITLAKEGLRQILWGLLKKVVVADNLAPFVDQIFSEPGIYSTPTLLLGTVYFALQIYCDFSGYSDIAIGAAKLFGFELRANFAYPYFSRSLVEFWRRWHISLSSWFRDYVYISLGGSRTSSKIRHLLNLMMTFCISGLWHGASWTFIAWGALHGLYYLPSVLRGRKVATDIVAQNRMFPSAREMFAMLTTFSLVCFAWIFFRADSVSEALMYIEAILQNSWTEGESLFRGLKYVLPVLVVEWIQREKPFALSIGGVPKVWRWLIYYLLIFLLFREGNTDHVPFVYFQF